MQESLLYKARFIASTPTSIFENGCILTQAGTIIEVGVNKKPISSRTIDLGYGIIIPALINTHTHLELTAFKNKIPYKYGFKEWINKLLIEREAAEKEKLASSAKIGINELLNTGCAACAEISTLGITKKIFTDSHLCGVWFQEKFGDIPQIQKKRSLYKNYLKYFSYAGHAPHTTSPYFLKKLKNFTLKSDLPFSIHTCESAEEVEFITTGKGEWAELLTQRGINYKDWELPAQNPVKHLEKLGILDSKTIAVHLTYASDKEYEIVKKHNTKAVLCLRSNKNIHNRLPDVKKMMNLNINISLGTDSLASVDTLDILDETAFMAHSFPNINPAEILRMATINGAKALMIDNQFGTIEKGKKASFLYLPIEASNKKKAIEAAIHKSFTDLGIFILEGKIIKSKPIKLHLKTFRSPI